MRDFVEQIFEVAPTASPLMEQINQASSELLTSVQSLQSKVTETQGALSGMQSRLSEKLSSLQQRVGQSNQAVQQEKADTEAKTTAFKETIGEITEGVTGALETAQQQMESFRGHVDTARQWVEDANETAQGVIQTVHGHVDQGRQLLHQATDFADTAIDGLQSKIDDTLSFAESTYTNLADGVETGLRDAGAKIEEMTGVSFADMKDVFTSGMELVQGNVIENGVNMALDSLQGMIQEQLNQLVDQLLDEMMSCLGNIRENLFGNAEESGLERKMLEPILNQLDSILDPLFSAVDHLKGLAAMVGIDV